MRGRLERERQRAHMAWRGHVESCGTCERAEDVYLWEPGEGLPWENYCGIGRRRFLASLRADSEALGR
jgi:hypothetical protein